VQRFRYGERVVVSDPRHHLYERSGTVTTVRGDGAGVVQFDRALPEAVQLVIRGIRYERESIVYPGHCRRLRR
jgi:hypothetical protein